MWSSVMTAGRIGWTFTLIRFPKGSRNHEHFLSTTRHSPRASPKFILPGFNADHCHGTLLCDLSGNTNECSHQQARVEPEYSRGPIPFLSPAVPLRDATDKQRFPEQGRAAKRAGIMTRVSLVTAPHTGTGQATAQPAAPLSLPAPSSMHIVRTGRSSQTCSGFSRGHVAWTTVLHLHSQHAM